MSPSGMRDPQTCRGLTFGPRADLFLSRHSSSCAFPLSGVACDDCDGEIWVWPKRQSGGEDGAKLGGFLMMEICKASLFACRRSSPRHWIAIFPCFCVYPFARPILPLFLRAFSSSCLFISSCLLSLFHLSAPSLEQAPVYSKEPAPSTPQGQQRQAALCHTPSPLQS